MADHEPLPVAGYTAQSDEKVALVNEFKQDEERLLRKLDALGRSWTSAGKEESLNVVEQGFMRVGGPTYDQRWLAVARTHFQEGFSALTRAVFQPRRIRLPEDGE